MNPSCWAEGRRPGRLLIQNEQREERKRKGEQKTFGGKNATMDVGRQTNGKRANFAEGLNIEFGVNKTAYFNLYNFC